MDSSDDGADSDPYSEHDDVSDRAASAIERGNDDGSGVMSDEPSSTGADALQNGEAGVDTRGKPTGRRGAGKATAKGSSAKSPNAIPQKRKV